MKIINRIQIQWINMLIILVIISGCTSINKKFRSSVEADVGIFADHTMAMLEAADFGISKNNALYTKDFFNYSEPEEIRFVADRNDVDIALKAMMGYSLKLVSIAETNGSTKTRIEAYVVYLKEMDDSILEALELGNEYYASLIIEVGEQEKFMGALKKAQPIIDALGRYMGKTLDDLEEAAEHLENKLDIKIDQRYAELIHYQKTLEKEKYAILSALEHLHLSAKGDSDAYNRLKNGETVVPVEIIPEGPLTYEQRWKIAKHLMKTLNMIDDIWRQIQPDWELYRDTHLELDRLHKKLNDETRRVRLITLVWLRAHLKMASGVVSPAEWFNIDETPSMLIKMGTSAVF